MHFRVLLETHIYPNSKMRHFLILNTDFVGDGAFDVPRSLKCVSRAVVGASPYGFCGYFREREMTLSTWVKTTKGLKTVEKRGV